MRFSRKLLLAFVVIFSIFAALYSAWTASTQPVAQPKPAQQTQPAAQAESARKCVMTIFIHGTVGPHLSFKAIGSWIKSLFNPTKRKMGAFQRYIEEVKKYSFHWYQPINDLGLLPVPMDQTITKSTMGYMARHTSLLYKKVYEEAYPENKDDIRFYTFGWNGRLKDRMRRQGAVGLYDAVIEEKERLRKETRLPVEVWCLAHSHGVNVMLYLEDIEKEKKKNLCIEKGIFFGGPIQSETEKYVNNSVFKDMYNIYSRGDHIQRIDCLSTKDWFSRQTFGSHKKKKVVLPANLNQIEVVVGDCRPFHYELWLWARKNFPYFFYRRRLELYPLPVSVFTPAIVELADKVDMSKDPDRNCCLRIDGNEGKFLLCGCGQKASRTIDVVPLKQNGRKAL